MEGIDGGSGQCISNMVVLAMNMPDICGKLRDISEVTLLST
jgi:hypothetical protein